MKPKPMPGPYSFDGFGVNCNDEFKSRVATMSRFIGEQECKATGRLLALAPEMLEALVALVRVADSNPFMPIGQFVEHGFPELRATLAKATGTHSN